MEPTWSYFEAMMIDVHTVIEMKDLGLSYTLFHNE